MVADPGLSGDGLDYGQIEPEREVRERLACLEPATVQQPECGLAHAAAFPPVECLLRQPEVAPGTPADLHGDERRWRPGVNRHHVQLVPADMEVSGEDRPAEPLEPGRDELFGGISRVLGGGPPVFALHQRRIAGGDLRRLIR
jgi:hypothetical protein